MLRSKLCQGFAQLGTARKVLNLRTGSGQHVVGVTQFKGAVEVGQVGAKCKDLARRAARGLVQERQQQTCVSLHGA